MLAPLSTPICRLKSSQSKADAASLPPIRTKSMILKTPSLDRAILCRVVPLCIPDIVPSRYRFSNAVQCLDEYQFNKSITPWSHVCHHAVNEGPPLGLP